MGWPGEVAAGVDVLDVYHYFVGCTQHAKYDLESCAPAGYVYECILSVREKVERRPEWVFLLVPRLSRNHLIGRKDVG